MVAARSFLNDAVTYLTPLRDLFRHSALRLYRQERVAERPEYATEVIEAVLMGFEEGLLRRIGIGPVKPIAGRHAPHREELQRAQLAIQFHHSLEPVNLAFLPLLVALRDEHLPSLQTQFISGKQAVTNGGIILTAAR